MIQVRNWGTGRRGRFIFAELNGVTRSWSDTEGVRIDVNLRESEPALDEAKYMIVRLDRKSAQELVTRLSAILAQGVDP
jgi:hypothetical protein